MDDSADRDANKLKSLISSFGLEQHVKQSTHRSGHILDIVITRADDPLVSSVIAEDRGFPDHFPVFIETVLDKPQARKKTVSYRSIKRIDPVALKTVISHSHLADMNSDLPLEKQIGLYDSVLGAILNEMAPLKTKTITSRTNAEWYNEQIARQNKVDVGQRGDGDRGSQLQVDKDIFIEHRHKVNELIDVLKRDHYRNLITSCSDSKPLFRVLNQLLGRKREAQPPEKTPLVLAEMFSQFFIETISDIRDSIPDANDPTPPFPSPACCFTQFAPLTRFFKNGLSSLNKAHRTDLKRFQNEQRSSLTILYRAIDLQSITTQEHREYSDCLIVYLTPHAQATSIRLLIPSIHITMNICNTCQRSRRLQKLMTDTVGNTKPLKPVLE
ncbi:hypothetical protein CAPTEDRAFT_203729 [Capitella teleta]|uniref:Endonuclease/exonuclease/phosphatase domain-containing protein n=1 Tax=Capitella teleta TaxID=283909 RepID=R7USA4_CAPTE|nr:hypothetical protein CAPTEDRAFT_203729 [Capitella teleta]|eukprot:ELU09050.1 hypothetical protein CAPTEDRAFT_203729 [Capitella teleta]